MSPKSTLNGDTLLVADRPNGGVNLFLGDFTGHGLAAAIGVVPLSEIFYRMTASGHPAQSVLLEINRKLHQLLPANFFCAAAMAEFAPDMRSVRIWVGGVPDAVLYQHETSEAIRVRSDHLPLGILSSDQFSVSMHEYDLSPGDRLYFWSDGLPEAVNSRDEMFGEERVMAVFSQHMDSGRLFDQLISEYAPDCRINHAHRSPDKPGSLSDDASHAHLSLAHPTFA